MIGDMRISYPKDFATDVRKEFEGREDVLSMLENQDCALGRVLAEEASKRVEPKEIVHALEEGNQASLMTRAQSLVRRAAIYRRWLSVAMDNVDLDDGPADPDLGQTTGV